MSISLLGFGYFLYQAILLKLFSDKEAIIINCVKRKIIRLSMGVLMVALVILGALLNGSVNYSRSQYGANTLLFLLDALAGTVGLIFVFISFGKSMPFIEFFGKNSLIILCTHMFIVNSFWMLNGHFFHIELASVNAGLFTLCVLLIEVPIAYIINTFFPFLIGRKRPTRTKSNNADKSNMV